MPERPLYPVSALRHTSVTRLQELVVPASAPPVPAKPKREKLNFAGPGGIIYRLDENGRKIGWKRSSGCRSNWRKMVM